MSTLLFNQRLKKRLQGGQHFYTGSNNATASALLSGEGKFIGLFCRGNHRESECLVVTNIEERKGILNPSTPPSAFELFSPNIYSINCLGHSFNFGTMRVGAYYSPYIFNKQRCIQSASMRPGTHSVFCWTQRILNEGFNWTQEK